MSNIEKVLNGDLSVRLSIPEFEEVHKKLIKSIATSRRKDKQQRNLTILLRLGATIDITDHQRIWYNIRAMEEIMTSPKHNKTLPSHPKWGKWADRVMDMIAEHLRTTEPVPFYNVSYKDIPFDWQNV